MSLAQRRLLLVTTVALTARVFLVPFARRLRARGWRVDVLTAGAGECEALAREFDRAWDIRWSRGPAAPSNFLSAPGRVRSVVREGGYDVVHVHTPVASFVTRYALRGMRRRRGPAVIYTAHGFHFSPEAGRLRNAWFLALEKLAGRWTDHLVVINREDEAAAVRHRLVSPGRLLRTPGIGVDTTGYAPDRVADAEIARIREEIGLVPSDRLFLLVAEFRPVKRHGDAIEAFARLGRRDAHLALAGRGPLMERMRRLALDLNVADRVHFLGYREDVPALVRASVATLLPSEREGLPRCVMESLSLEVPVIATAIRGTRELLAGGCGLLVRVGDRDGLREAMRWILEHPREARLMGTRGRRRMATYDLERVLRMHEDLYAEACKEAWTDGAGR